MTEKPAALPCDCDWLAGQSCARCVPPVSDPRIELEAAIADPICSTVMLPRTVAQAILARLVSSADPSDAAIDAGVAAARAELPCEDGLVGFQQVRAAWRAISAFGLWRSS